MQCSLLWKLGMPYEGNISVVKVIICPNQHIKQKQGHTESRQILLDSWQRQTIFISKEGKIMIIRIRK
jgi:hypothetical protein